MSINDPQRLKHILSKHGRLAKVFSRHTYGMLSWVDLFEVKLGSITNNEAKLIAARLIADNAKHAKLFSYRAKELGEKPETYKPPEIGQKIYDILETYNETFDQFAFAWGSLVHFSALLDIYWNVGDSQIRNVIEIVQKDVMEHLELFEDYFDAEANTPEKRIRAEEIRMLAESIYAEREDEEIEWYES